MKQRLLTLEAGRGVASLLVVLSHATTICCVPQSELGIDVGPVGVVYFFVLSGLIITLTHLDGFGRLPEIPKFLWRRFCRIYPIYWVVLVPLCIHFSDMVDAGKLATWLTLAPSDKNNVLGVAWSLRHEVVFYATFALMMLPRVGLKLLIPWTACTICLNSAAFIPYYPFAIPQWVREIFHPFNVEFLCGVAAGWIVTQRRLPVRAWILAPAGLAVFLANFGANRWGREYGDLWSQLYYGIGIGLMLLGLVASERNGLVRVPRLLLTLGDASYAIYLAHVPLIIFFLEPIAEMLPGGNFGAVLRVLFLFISATILGIALHVLVERPVLSLLRSIRLPASAAPATTRP